VIKPNGVCATYLTALKLIDLGFVRPVGRSNFTIAFLEKIRFAPNVGPSSMNKGSSFEKTIIWHEVSVAVQVRPPTDNFSQS
jgi:hypothetical protein